MVAHASARPRSTPRRNRAEGVAERRVAIVDAALAEFTEKGFAATRMEDVARRAGVAKGTIYLHFADKQALFGAIVESAMVPVVEELSAHGPQEGERLRDFLDRVIVPLAATLATGPRSQVIRLMISEGVRFPEMAETYYRQVVARGLGRLLEVAERADVAGEPGSAVLAAFPQLLIAPVILGVIWSGLFGRLQPLDTAALVRAQLDLLLGERR